MVDISHYIGRLVSVKASVRTSLVAQQAELRYQMDRCTASSRPMAHAGGRIVGKGPTDPHAFHATQSDGQSLWVHKARRQAKPHQVA